MAKTNPFAISMVTMIVPPHMGSSMNVSGFEIEADDEGKVDVPAAMVETLKHHGLVLESDTVAPAPAVPQRGSQRPVGTVPAASK